MKSFEQQVLDLYIDQGKSAYETASLLSTYPNRVIRTLRKLGHHPRTRSESQKVALESGRAKHPSAGKEMPQNVKLKISSKLTKHWAGLDKEDRDKFVSMAKQRWEQMSSSQKQAMRDHSIEAIRDAGKNGSKLEKFLLRKITDFGFAVEFHKKNLIPNENLEIDMYIPSLKTIIEIDGPSHFLPLWGEEKLQKQIKADIDKTGLILSMGYAIIRVKVMKTLSLSQMEEAAVLVNSTLRNIQFRFPPKTKRLIEVEL